MESCQEIFEQRLSKKDSCPGSDVPRGRRGGKKVLLSSPDLKKQIWLNIKMHVLISGNFQKKKGEEEEEGRKHNLFPRGMSFIISASPGHLSRVLNLEEEKQRFLPKYLATQNFSDLESQGDVGER